MDHLNIYGSYRSYSDVLLEEIALEGLDGITLELLWNRLRVNPEWKVPIDEFTEAFIWEVLISLDHLDWYELKEPRVSPPVFATTEEFMQAAESKLVDTVNFSVKYYPHKLINDGDVIGSCSTYYERKKVTSEIQTSTLNDVKSNFGNRLVLVASQSVRNFVLITPETNPSFELSDLSYCILERVGRSRRCGEFSISLHFMKNGANPTYYFWNKLRKINIITTQQVSFPKEVRGTLLHLTRFYRRLTSEMNDLVLQIIEKIKSSPVKMCLFSDAKELFASCRTKKFTKNEIFRCYLKACFVPYSEYDPETAEAKLKTKNGGPKLIRVLKLINDDYNKLLQGDVDENVNENMNEVALLEKRILHSRTVISQCYHLIRGTGDQGMSMVDLELQMGVSKLMARGLLKALQRIDLIVSVSSDDARKRFFRYFSKDYFNIVKSRIEEQVRVPEFMDTSTMDEMNSMAESYATDFKEEVNPESDQVLINNENSETTENVECSDSNEHSKHSEISEAANNSEITEATKRPSSTDISKLDERSVKRPKLENPLPQEFLRQQVMSVMSEPIECSVPAGESIFVMRRINIVLNHVYKFEVVHRSYLGKIIIEEETKRGIHQGIPARNSLKKVVDILSKSGKVKLIKKTITNEAFNKTRELEFLCIPTATEDHPIIQSAVQETINSLSIVYVKCGPKTAPEKLDYQPRLAKSRHGYGPKFNRMKVLHELVTYLVYHYEGKENLDPEENMKFVRPLLGESESLHDLPTIYKREISWKMFIPPLMHFEEYGDGWISQNDIAERLPLKLFFNLIRIPYDHPDFDVYLKHPIKRYYLLRHLPDHLQKLLFVDKRYLYSLCLNLRLLCYVGLCQFGPKTKTRGFQNLVYVNKTTQLLDTRLSPPGYYHVSSDVDYNCTWYNLTDPGSVEAYWNDALRFSVGTKLGRKTKASEPDEKARCRRLPDRLALAAEPRSFEEVRRNDNGEMPGNKRGAGGFDSWMFAHKHNLWFVNQYEKPKTEGPAPPKKTKPAPTRAAPVKPVSKLMRFRHQVIRNREYNRSKISYDKVDMAALSKLRTLRCQWSKHEDEILLMCLVASQYYSKPTILYKYRPYILVRKILHSLSERSADKTVHACKRRINSLTKVALRQHSINLCLKELANDVEMKQKFRHLCKSIEKASSARDGPKTKALMDGLTEQVFHHLYESKKINVSTKGTVEFSLPDDVDTFRENFNYEYATIKGSDKYLELTGKKEISTLLVVNLIFSALYSQVDKSKSLNAGFLYSVFKQFEDADLKSALHYVRVNRLIAHNKSTHRNRGLLLPIGSGVFHLSLTYHLLLKIMYRTELFSCIYSKFLELFSLVDRENINIAHFDVGLTTLLISHHMLNNVFFQTKVPESLLLFNEDPVGFDESVLKKMVMQARKFSETTLAMVSEQLPKCSDNDGVASVKDECDKMITSEDNLGDDGDDEEEDDRLIDFSISKISIYVTRNQFKHSDIRFSNAYDHFKMTPFSVSYSIDDKTALDAHCVNRTLFLERLEKNVAFKKIAYTPNELQQKIRKCFHESGERDFATSVLEFLLIKGLCGVSTTELATEFGDVRLLEKVVGLMVRKKLIIRDGSVDTRFVHINFGEHWLLLTCKNKNIFANKSPDPSVDRKPKDAFRLNESHDSLWVTIRPWVHFDGSVNEAALDSILLRVLSCVVKFPGSPLIGVQKKFLPALQPHATRELLEFLEQLKCIKSYIFSRKTKPSLFSTSVAYTCEDEVNGFEDEDTIVYEPLPHCFVTFSVFLSSTSINDLLEIKYSTDMCGAVNKPGEVQGKDVAQDSS